MMKENQLVTFKPCPRCSGTGIVPCDGKEHLRKEYREWAESYHLKPVSYKCSWLEQGPILGVAVSQVMPGGWHGLKVYIKITDIPRTAKMESDYGSYHAYKIDGRGVPQPFMKLESYPVWTFDIINDKAFWYVFCRHDEQDEITRLDFWPDFLGSESQVLLDKHSIRNGGG